MKRNWTIISWVFGLVLCVSSIVDFESSNTGLALFLLALGLALLPPVTKALFNLKQSESISHTVSLKTQSTNTIPNNLQLKIKSVQFPEIVDEIDWHINEIDNAIKSNDYSLADLYYAKLIESIRQQNVNEKGKYDDTLRTFRFEHESFRQLYNIVCPPQSLPADQRSKTSSANSGTPEHAANMVKITSKSNGIYSTEFTIELNENELLKRVKDGTLRTDKSEITIENITGFYGTEQFSPNKLYCVSYLDGHSENGKWKNGEIALLKGNTLLFKKKVQRPIECYVSNEGIIICCDWQYSDVPKGKFLIFDTSGEKIFFKNTKANLGTCAISENSKFALFETYNSDTSDDIFIVDIQQKQIIQSFQRPTSFNKAIIDDENKRIKLEDPKGLLFEIDFAGAQTNKSEYENQIMTKGSVFDQFCLYSQKSDDVKFKDTNYLDLLKNALTDKESSYSFGKASIYRMIGEYYEANGDIPKTIENWEKAMQIDSKIGVKRKLVTLKKKYFGN